MKEDATEKKLGFLPKLGIFFILLVVISYIYMRYYEPKQLEVIEYPIINSKIPEEFNGFKIVHFSDLLFGVTTTEKEMDRIVQRINESKPDLVLFTGDLISPLIHISDKSKESLLNDLTNIHATLGKYAILGDNDYSNETNELLISAQFKILKNENIPIYYQSVTPIYLGGIPSISKQEQNLSLALQKTENAYQILMMHEPMLFDEVLNNADLVLAGHTLGGLIRIPGIGGIIKGKNSNNYQKGKYEKNNSILFVSSGIGTEKINLRFLNYPSFYLYRLYHE